MDDGQWLLLTFEKVQPAIGACLPFDSQIARPEPSDVTQSINIIEHQSPKYQQLQFLFAMLFAPSPFVIQVPSCSFCTVLSSLEASRYF